MLTLPAGGGGGVRGEREVQGGGLDSTSAGTEVSKRSHRVVASSECGVVTV